MVRLRRKESLKLLLQAGQARIKSACYRTVGHCCFKLSRKSRTHQRQPPRCRTGGYSLGANSSITSNVAADRREQIKLNSSQ